MITALNSTIQKRAEAALVAFLRAKFLSFAPQHFSRVEIGEVNGLSESSGTDAGDVTDSVQIQLAAEIPAVFPGDRLIFGETYCEIRRVVQQTAELLSVDVVSGALNGTVSIVRTSRIRLSDDTASREGLPWLCVVQASNLTETWAGANNYKGTLYIGLDGASNLIEAEQGDPLTLIERNANLAIHNSRAALIATSLSDVPAVGEFVHNSAQCGVTDFTLAGLLSSNEPGSNAEMGCFTWLLTRAIVCEGMSY